MIFEPAGAQFHFYGRIGDRIRANQQNWFQSAPTRSPRMLGILQERKTGPTPPQWLLAFVGEYPGKYLIGAVHALRLTGDPALRAVVAQFVTGLIASQGGDGYLGPFPPNQRLKVPDKWDLWGHYHCMLGLLLWSQDQNDAAALASCRRAADLICATFLDTGARVPDEGNPEKNEAIAHVFVLLYRATGEPRYLRMAREIERDWTRADGGNYVDGFQHNEPFFLGRQPRWESLHSVQSIAEFYALKNDWQPWFPLGPNVFPANSAITSLSTTPGGTSLFLLGSDGQVWSKFFDPQNPVWSPWFALGPNVFPAGAPIAAISTTPGGTSLFVLGSDGQVWSKFFDPQNRVWSPWFALGPNTFPSTSSVTALSTKPGGTSLFVPGSDGQVWTKVFDPQNPSPPSLGGWQPWLPLGPNTFPNSSHITALSAKPGGTSLFVLGSDGQVWTKVFDPQNPGPPSLGGWQPWFPLGPNVFPPGAKISAITTKPSGTSLFILGLDGQVWSKFFDPQNLGPPSLGGWQPWFALLPYAFPANTPTTALSTKPSGTSVFITGLDRQVWSTFFDPQNLAGDRYLRAFTDIWQSILVNDRHITGGFTSAEAAHGNPFDPRPIETCATVAWMCLTLDMLRLTGDSRAADELELSTLNAVLGSQSADASWWTYDTPMGGILTTGMSPLGFPNPLAGPPYEIPERCPTLYDLRWQEAAGVALLTCCAANGPRGLAMLSQWAVMRSADGIAVNYYGTCDLTALSPANQSVSLTQSTAYPLDGAIQLTVAPTTPERFVLRVRIPGWTTQAQVAINNQTPAVAQPGTYFAFDRLWSSGDTVRLQFDMGPRFVMGGPRPPTANTTGDASGRMAVYYGPLLLAYDSRFGRYSPSALPVIDRTATTSSEPSAAGIWNPLLLLTLLATDGSTITLCDFASAGAVPWIPTRRWRFSRKDETLLAPQLVLLPDGTIQGSTHPNETRWAFEDTRLTFYNAAGAPTTRFTPVYTPGDRTHLKGAFLPDPTITHILNQLDADLTDTIWDFVRADANSPIRLDPGGRIHGYQHPNEAGWRLEGNTLVFFDQSGQATTRFTQLTRVNQHRELSGPFLPDPRIVHVLRELDLGWVRGSRYVAWLPAR